MRRKLLLIFEFVVLAINISCSKSGGTSGDEPLHVDESDDVFPEVIISKPLANQLYVNGDSIIIEGRTTDQKGLYKGKVFLANDISGSIVKEQNYEIHFFKSFDFRIAYKAVVSAETDFTATAEFEDHGSNKTIKTVKVKVNP